jgi:hypothetical protein
MHLIRRLIWWLLELIGRDRPAKLKELHLWRTFE